MSDLADQWAAADARLSDLDCRHFFSGAAAYRNGAIVASLTPVGLAFKVPTEVHDKLLKSGRASPLRYFHNAPTKRNYVLFPPSETVSAADAALMILGDHPQS